MQLLKRTKKKNNIKIIQKGLLLLIALFVVILFYYLNAINSSVGSNSDKEFVITRGDSVSKIADNLEDEGLIKSPFIFKVYIRLMDKDPIFREGSYVLNTQMNVKEIVKELSEKITLRPEKSITFIEGWNLNDYAKALEEKGFFTSEEFFALAGRPMTSLDSDFLEELTTEFEFLKDRPSGSNLEGYLFPDTYRFFEDASAEDVIMRMLRNFDQKLNSQMRAEIENQDKTIYEIVNMASIIQKEVQSEADMKMVSGIFWNRLGNRQALESCASLAYILGVNKAIYSYEDTRTPSPYNTYINRGLPPGPISNPGLRALEAAIYPTENDYNFFLSVPETKETIFSITYQEHLRNRDKYLK